jgi:hypothetical protein
MGDFHNADCSELGFPPGLGRKLLICTTTRDDTGKNLQVFFVGGGGFCRTECRFGFFYLIRKSITGVIQRQNLNSCEEEGDGEEHARKCTGNE